MAQTGTKLTQKWKGQRDKKAGRVILCFVINQHPNARLRLERQAGDGSARNAYQISRTEQLASIGPDPNLLDKHFALTNDINMDPAVKGIPAFTTAVIAPDTGATVGGEFEGTAFSGVFDGNGYKIMNLIIYTLADSDSSNDENGYLGLFGRIGLGGEIRELHVENCSITGGRRSDWLGGLCGYNDGTLFNCYANGSVTGNDYVAGLCAKNWGGTVSYCYASGRVSGGDNIGGLCGLNEQGTVSDCFWDTDTSGLNASDGGTGLTTAKMQQAGTYISAGWDFVGETLNGPSDIWTIKEGFDYPKHVWKLVNFVGWDGVDLKDYCFFAQQWGRTDCSEVTDCSSTDLDFSGSISSNDLCIFATYWLSGQ